MVDQSLEAMKRDFLAWCEKQKADASVQLERFKSGMLTIGISGPAGHIDGSARMMDHLRDVIASMDELIPQVEADLGFLKPDQ